MVGWNVRRPTSPSPPATGWTGRWHATRAQERPNDRRLAIEPDLPVDLTSTQYFASRDRAVLARRSDPRQRDDLDRLGSVGPGVRDGNDSLTWRRGRVRKRERLRPASGRGRGRRTVGHRLVVVEAGRRDAVFQPRSNVDLASGRGVSGGGSPTGLVRLTRSEPSDRDPPGPTDVWPPRARCGWPGRSGYPARLGARRVQVITSSLWASSARDRGHRRLTIIRQPFAGRYVAGALRGDRPPTLQP